MGSQEIFSAHLLLLCAPTWGHFRPLCAFASKVVVDRPDFAITFMITGGHEWIQGEIDRCMADNEAKSKANIRLVDIGRPSQGFDIPEFLSITISAISGIFPDYYQRLIRCEPVQCKTTGTTFPAIRRPTAVILDIVVATALPAIRALTGRMVPIFTWNPASAFTMLRLFGSEELGGLGDVSAKASILAKATGRTIEEIAHELSHPAKGELVMVPGLPTQFDYEYFPQRKPNSPVLVQDIQRHCYQMTNTCDGMICTSSSAYEPESIDALRKWLGTDNRELYIVGPLATPGEAHASVGISESAKSLELASSDNGGDYQAFMNNITEKHGDKSLIYVSFGSVWWPAEDEYLWVFVNVLLELKFPFILSIASLKGGVPTELAEKVKTSGIGLISKWSPQKMVLNHPVTGWVLTHCGQNTVMEALMQGIPLIAWPIDVDQPANAAHITLTLDVAFELIQVRSGEHGLKPLYRGVQPTGTLGAVASEVMHVLHSARGEEGKRKRRNAEMIRDKLKKGWEEDGEGLLNFRRLLRDVSSEVVVQLTMS